MKSGTAHQFQGFSHDALTFLAEVHRRNSKSWYDAQRSRYESVLLEPLRRLVADLGDTILRIDDHIEVFPSVNKTISRLHRDTRFSADKSLFKDAVWITFKRPRNQWRDYPAFFFELRPTAYRFGVGFYSASPATMVALRTHMQEQKSKFRSATKFLQGHKTYAVEGETYKRDLKLDLPPELQTFAQRKNLYIVCNRKPDRDLFSPQLAASIRIMYKQAAPFYRCMQEAAACSVRRMGDTNRRVGH